MNHNAGDAIVVSLLKEAVESEGCSLSAIDLDKLVIRVNGPDDVVSNGAMAVAKILE